jgi:hypothetical protein
MILTSDRLQREGDSIFSLRTLSFFKGEKGMFVLLSLLLAEDRKIIFTNAVPVTQSILLHQGEKFSGPYSRRNT